ncbi:haloacid dehalogenase [Meridianimarinicoccus roseus]|uniref:phosphoglycolate phosphatase n=1 Tax=Meridianimarinicoccus roseus TaxID=2072018 RepID=A0A2V2LBB6_9RHOB|nr:HAD-IA family hydrolase [Meridianimarinicoccus roseus]PWR00814.1 haloacid dehalogenase [Meridianimarinicoccus roseus]
MATVVFDLDGTLADTSGDLIAAANHVFRARGLGDLLHPERDALTAFAGGRAMLKLGFGRAGPGFAAEDIEAGYPMLLGAYGDAIDVHTRLYPGAMDAVAALRADGYRVSICTNKPEALARSLLTRLGVLDAFGALVGADTLPVRKPDPAPFRAAVERAGGDPARAVLIGDTVTDRDTARAAGAPCVLVGFGPLGDGVSALEPDALLPDYADLGGIVARLMPVG